MSIKQKIKSIIDKFHGKMKSHRSETDSELAAEEVIEQEVFPAPRKTNRKIGDCDVCKITTTSANKKPSKRTRPTNGNYRMIDPSNDTADGGKS